MRKYILLLALISFGKLGVIPVADGEKSCFPFENKRKGALAGEAAGIVIMASEEFVNRNNLKPVAQFMGYGNTLDGYKITAPDPAGTAMVHAIQDSINNAGITADMIDYINAHGTSTPAGDAAETQAIKAALGADATSTAVSSTKSMIGHLLGAAGGVEAIFCALAIRDQVAPPTINLDNPDPECDLDYVPHTARDMTIDVAMSNSFGFGGTNGTLIFKKLS